MKWLLKWIFRLVLLLVVLGVILLLSLNSILRLYLEHQIHARTGMEAEIGKFSLGLTQPTITIQNFKLYNPPDFGGTPFLDIRELHAEYDPAALAKRQLHLTLVRFNLSEMDIVKNEAGKTNLLSLVGSVSVKRSGAHGKAEFTRQTGLEFTGIDVLNISLGTFKFIDLKDPSRNRAQNIGIENCVMKNVHTPTDLAGLALLVVLRGGGFFGSLFDVPKLRIPGN
ncbi:MAG TPA: hypothetical protein VMB80_17110 [Candidatus Acidoferrum sp.]|nr:hypothetical protein [Candidatus Acidoferrum sp.]